MYRVYKIKDVSEILSVETTDKKGQLRVIHKDGHEVLCSGTIKGWSRRFAKDLLRVNSSSLVAKDSVRANFANKRLILSDARPFTISKTFLSENKEDFSQFKYYEK